MNDLKLFVKDKMNQLVVFLALGVIVSLLMMAFTDSPSCAPIISLIIAIFAGTICYKIPDCLFAAVEFLIGVVLGLVILGLFKTKGVPPGGIFAVFHLSYNMLLVNIFYIMPCWLLGLPIGRFLRRRIF